MVGNAVFTTEMSSTTRICAVSATARSAQDLGGSGLSATNTTHRIDAEAVKQQVTAAGFTLDAEGDALIRAADDRTTKGAFENSQFMLRFRKPQ